MGKIITSPIEGFFIQSREGLIFDVKGLSQPDDKVIAFVRYVPNHLYQSGQENTLQKYIKIYDLVERHRFLKRSYPEYIFEDPKGRGSLQAVPEFKIDVVYHPIDRLKEILGTNLRALDSLELEVLEFVARLKEFGGLPLDIIGISGSILVKQHKTTSDIDLIIYGKENGFKLYNAMPSIFEKVSKITRYTTSELETLWENRGQTEQIDFQSFMESETRKNMQGMFGDRDFYIRLVLYPDEYFEPYNETTITQLGEIEIEATIEDDEYSIFTPCIYKISEVELISSTKLCEGMPDRIFSLRGRYCDLAKKGERVLIRGKLERVDIKRHKEYYQLTLGSLKNEFFKLM